MRDELFSAERGQGASLNGRRLQVSQVTELLRSLLVTGFPYDAWSTPHNNLENYGRFARLTQGVRRLGSAALDLCYVAAGRLEGYWELSIKPWDVAAGGLIAIGSRCNGDEPGRPGGLPDPAVFAAGRSAQPARQNEGRAGRKRLICFQDCSRII